LNLLGLKEHPFAAGHDPRFIHATSEREEALVRLRHGLQCGESFLLVTGEPGIGKTSLVLEALDDEGAAAAFVTQPALKPRELLEEACIRFEIPLPRGASKPQVMARLERHLTDLRKKGLSPVLALDDAQNASPELLEELRVLSNLEVDGRPLLQIVLMALPELERRLAGPEMARVRQRVATHCHLEPFSPQDTKSFLHARVAAAGGNPAIFPLDTCVEIHRLARGVPRAINTIAGEALLKASRESAKMVTPSHVQASAADSWLRSVSDGGAAIERGAAGTSREETPAADAAPRKAGDVNEWVSRFVDGDRPLMIGGQIMAERAAEASRREWEETNGPEEPREAAAEEAPPPPRRRSALRGSRRGTRRGSSGRLSLAVGGLLVASVTVFLGGRWTRRSHSEGSTRAAATETRASGATPATPAASAQPASAQPASQAPPSPERASAAAIHSAPGMAQRPPARGPAATDAPAETAPAAPVVRLRRGIETGSYLNPERAESERTLLAETTGLPVQVIEGAEDGAAVYRVVVGSFGSRRKASAALNELVGRGLVEQAKIISLPAPDPATP